MNPSVKKTITDSRRLGWIPEPLAKDLLQVYGLSTSHFVWAKSIEEALSGAQEVGYPLVAKVVSPAIIHKSDVGGVVVGVRDDEHLKEVFRQFRKLPRFDGILLDEMLEGVEVIIGSQNDPQFGTVVLIGIGGTAVEIYRDVAIRMAPLSPKAALNAIHSLTGAALLKGYRGDKAVNLNKLKNLLVQFSRMAYQLREEVSSIDLNPVLCTDRKAVVADARFILKEESAQKS